MFERYTEKSRRVIFFARYEASVWGADHIDTSHLLLALLREDRALFTRLFGRAQPFNNPAELLGLKLTGEKVSTSVDLPLTAEAKHVLAFAAAESESMLSQHIMPGHLLLGLLRQPSAASELLKKSGLQLPEVRLALLETAVTPANREMRVAVGIDLATANSKIIDQLRAQFEALTARLKPETEPAVVYRVVADKTK